jgi:serine/threonine-protein kinase HipA
MSILHQISPRKARLAMAVRGNNKHDRLRDIRAQHWAALAARSGSPALWMQLIECAETLRGSLEGVQALLPDAFPARLWSRVRTGMLARALGSVREARALYRLASVCADVLEPPAPAACRCAGPARSCQRGSFAL